MIKNNFRNLFFKTNSKQNKIFDIVLSILIILSIFVIIIESVDEITTKYYKILLGLEIFFTLIFSIEYFFRIYFAKIKKDYIFSFYGIIDFLSIIPLYISLIIPGAKILFTLRILRLFRLLRLFKTFKILEKTFNLTKLIKKSIPIIILFIISVLFTTIIFGSILSVVEKNEDFDNIPKGIYFAIITISTVGYGDITPETFFGKIIASVIIFLGYGIIAIPTGVLILELIKKNKTTKKIKCKKCNYSIDKNSKYCKNCGIKIKN
ncbi:MAG: ion transporter [Nanoarchaeota archaeon]